MLRDYLPVLLQIIVVVLFAVSALLVSILVGKRGKRTRAKDTAYECGMIPEGERQPRFSIKFHIVAMLFILFDLEIVFMYPWAVVYRDGIKQGSAIFWSMLSFISILMVGYAYALKKGALNFRK
jgi:NADH-quinone oxidoreductase subunit A